MTLGLLDVKEIDSITLEQKTCQRFEETYCLQLLLKRLNNKIEKTKERSKDSLELYKKFHDELSKIINANVSLTLDDNIGLVEDVPKYKLLNSSAIQIGDDVLELSDNEEEENEYKQSQINVDYKVVKIKGVESIGIDEDIYIPAKTFGKLFEHQRRGLRWLVGLHKKKHGGILADDMGLGKTVTVLSLFHALIFSIDKGIYPMDNPLSILIVCTITLINQWKDEIKKWLPKTRFEVYHSTQTNANKDDLLNNTYGEHYILITSYETLRINIESFNLYNWSYVVLDEGQKIRNPDSAITLAVKTLGTPHRLLLSGSPIQNNLVEFWSLLDFVAPGHLGTLPLFTEQFVDPITSSRDTSNSSVAYNCAIRLRSLILPFIQRSIKSDFIKSINLPQKTEHVLLCSLTSSQHYVYVNILKSLEHLVFNKRSNKILSLLTLLRKVCNHPDLVLKDKPDDYGNVDRCGKLKITLEIISKWESEKRKMLLFSQTIQMLNIIHDNLIKIYPEDRVCRVDGTIPLKTRNKIIHDFNDNNSKHFILLLTTRVGGVGLNLTSADRLLIYDPDWNPMTDSQARERCYRIGQTRNVQIYRLITAHTIEEKIYHRQIYKFYLSERILSDPRVVNFRFIPSADFLQIPPEPSGPKNLSKNYLSNLQRQLNNKDFELELRRLNNSKDTYQNYDDICNGNNENPLLQSIFEKHEIEGIIKHDQIENAKISNIELTSSKIADNAIRLLKRSLSERKAYDISVPTWTGRSGRAAAPINKRLLHSEKSPNSRFIINNLKNLKERNHLLLSQGEEDIAKKIVHYFKQRQNYSSPTGNVSFSIQQSKLPMFHFL